MIRYLYHAYAVKDILGLRVRKGKVKVWGSEEIRNSSFSLSPFKLTIGEVSITLQRIDNQMVMSKWDERVMEETITLKFPADKLITDLSIADISELMYYLFIGCDDFGFSAHPIHEVPVKFLGKEEREWIPAIKSISVAEYLQSVSQSHGISYSIECDSPFCVTLELAQ